MINLEGLFTEHPDVKKFCCGFLAIKNLYLTLFFPFILFVKALNVTFCGYNQPITWTEDRCNQAFKKKSRLV